MTNSEHLTGRELRAIACGELPSFLRPGMTERDPLEITSTAAGFTFRSAPPAEAARPARLHSGHQALIRWLLLACCMNTGISATSTG